MANCKTRFDLDFLYNLALDGNLPYGVTLLPSNLIETQ